MATQLGGSSAFTLNDAPSTATDFAKDTVMGNRLQTGWEGVAIGRNVRTKLPGNESGLYRVQ